jgi:NosR/NirI family nitrous oxide reductase transcriptional regulator
VLAAVVATPFPMGSGQAQSSVFERRYKYELADVLPGAKEFERKQGYWEGFRRENGRRVLVGYVFLSKEWTEKLVGYSGRHLETLVGMDPGGRLTGAKILYHAEPILLIGLKEENLKEFIGQYPGKSIKEKLQVGKGITMDAITGATVTAVVENAIILGSARKVAAQAGLMTVTPRPRRAVSARFVPHSWEELLRTGGVARLLVQPQTLGLPGSEPYLDLYLGIAAPPAIGRNLLGDRMDSEVRSRLKPGESALIVVSRGPGSFKGSGFARGGIFDRFHLEQDGRAIIFRDVDYQILTHLEVRGGPAIREGGIFIIRDREFDPAAPIRFVLTLPYRVGVRKAVASFSVEYQLPERFLEKGR